MKKKLIIFAFTVSISTAAMAKTLIKNVELECNINQDGNQIATRILRLEPAQSVDSVEFDTKLVKGEKINLYLNKMSLLEGRRLIDSTTEECYRISLIRFQNFNWIKDVTVRGVSSASLDFVLNKNGYASNVINPAGYSYPLHYTISRGIKKINIKISCKQTVLLN